MNSIVNFNYFLDNNINIVIPQIQRDYAEGRKVGKAPKVRKNLLGDMLNVARAKTLNCELDFVYGYQNNSSFEPLDGQQRLTTLFLVYWFFMPNNQTLKVNNRPVLTYQNRPTSNDFCQKLIEQKAYDFIQSYKKSNTKLSFAEYISQLGFFRWDWQFDATIQSMLVVINDLFENTKNEITSFDQYYNNLINITFNFLDLNDYQMGNELYIKMNARGKELGSFDLLKSYLEKDCASLNNQLILHNWQELMDKDWMDYFWHKFYDDSDSDSISSVEGKFEQLLKILIFNQIIRKTDNCRIKKELNDDLIELQKADEIIDDCLGVYENCSFKLDYQEISNQINSLNHYDGSNFIDFADIIDQSFCDDIIKKDILNELLSSYQYYKNIFAYAGIKWIQEIYGFADISTDVNKKNNFNIYMRFIRNIYTSHNAGSIRVDNKEQLKNAFNWIDNLIENYKNNQSITFRQFIANTQLDNSGGQVETISLLEEQLKATLIENDTTWYDYINTIENNSFFLGQIWSLLYSSDNNIDKFKFLSEGLYDLFENIKNDGYKLLQLMLIIDEYYNSTKENTLVVLDKVRDRSLKYHLRTQAGDDGNSFLVTFRNLMNIWYNNYLNENFDEFYNNYKNDSQALISGFSVYRKFLITNNRWANTEYFMKDKQKIYIESDNNIYYRRWGSNKEELILAHIKGVIKTYKNKIFSLVEDACGQDKICFKFFTNGTNQVNNGKYTISFQNIDSYSVEKNDVITMANSSIDDVITYLNNNLENKF